VRRSPPPAPTAPVPAGPPPLKFGPNLGHTERDPRFQCLKCGTMLVSLVDFVPGSEQGYGERERVFCCPDCDGPVEMVNIVRGLYRRAGKEKEL
jgi:hypothetical protein